MDNEPKKPYNPVAKELSNRKFRRLVVEKKNKIIPRKRKHKNDLERTD